MSLTDITASAVQGAIDEFDRLGREPFLTKYGFAEAREYLLEKDGKHYDSKAIAGAAHGYLPGRRALRSAEFSGGEATVKKVLADLGFKVAGPTAVDLTSPLPGDVLTNGEIGDRFAVGNMGGMRRSRKHNLLVLISDPFKGLYLDRWEGDVLHYTGMGKSGDQSLTYMQNRTLAESPKTGITVHLLEALEPERYTYRGEVELVASAYQEEQEDEKKANRKVWMFPLRLMHDGPVSTLTTDQLKAIEDRLARKAKQLSTAELKRRAKNSKKKPSVRTTQGETFLRDAAVAEYTKRLAKGRCDLCEDPAPFSNKQGDPYLECHHIVWLSKGGEDNIENTVALCPNCHRKMHALNQVPDRERLQGKAVGRAAL